jgi:hypothetical protein
MSLRSCVFCSVACASIFFASVCFAQTETKAFKAMERFEHGSKAFSLTPPIEFRQVLEREDGVQFSNLIDKSIMNIVFTPMPEGITEAQLLERFNDDKYRAEWAKGLERGTEMKTKVLETKQRIVKDINGWEFVTVAEMAKGKRQNNYIVLFKNGKEYIIILSSDKDLFESKKKIFDESLATFEVK